MSEQVRRLAELVARHDAQITALGRERRLAAASMEGGAINVYQPGSEGLPGVALGEQYDGSYASTPLAGPTPPTPTTPTVSSAANALFVDYDGLFIDSLVAPMDWARVEIHVADTPNPPSWYLAETLKDTYETPRGGTKTIYGLPTGVPLWVWLVARTDAGKFSAPSLPAGPVEVVRLGVADIDVEEIGGNRIHRGPTEPTGDHRIGDLWLQTPNNIAYRWEGEPPSWVPSADQRIAQALSDAFDASQAASQAGADALAALGTAGTAQQTATDAAAAAAGAASLAQTAKNEADRKVVVYRQGTAPTGLTAADTNDLWINTADNNKLRVWDGDSWEVAEDQRIAAALTTAQGKTTVFAQDNAPSTTGRTTGDLWLDTNDGNRQYVWNGTAWTDARDAGIAAANTLAQTAKNEADRKVVVYRQNAEPTGLTAADTNDLWIDTDDSNKLYAWSGTAWVVADDQRIATALTTAQGKTTVFAQDTAPSTTGRVNGDLWIETDNDNRQYVWNGAWTPRALGAAAIAATARQLGAITTYRQANAPTSGMVVGDFWIDSDDNVLYRYEGTTPTWVKVQDTNIQTAITNAATAQAIADGKMRIYVQPNAPTGLTAGDDGDLWIETDNGNASYTWTWTEATTGTPAVTGRTNLATNPSFEDQPAGTYTTLTGWTNMSGGTVNVLTRSVAAAGAVYGSTVGKVVSSSLGQSTASLIGYQQTYTAAPGDIFRISAVAFVLVAGSNHLVELRAEWLTSTGTAISNALLRTGTGATGNQTLSGSTTAAPANATQLRLSLYRRGNGGGVNLAFADLNIDGVLVEKNVAAGTPTTFLIGSITDTPGSPSVPAHGDWVKRAIGNGAIEPQSLVARDVIATGTVSAALLESVLVLATTIIAGNPAAAHARLDAQGLRVFRGDINGDGTPDEAVRLGVAGASDRLATVKEDGSLGFVADDVGYITATGISTQQEPRINAPDHTGRGGTLYDILDRRPRGIVGWGSDTGSYDVNTAAGRGIFDIGARLEYGRMYKIVARCRVNGAVNTNNDVVAELQVRWTETADGWPTSTSTSGSDPGTPDAPNINSPIVGRLQGNLARWEAQGILFEKLFSFGPLPANSVPGTYKNVRFLLGMARPIGTTTIQVYGTIPDNIEMWVEDIGPYTRAAVTINNGGGTVSVPGPPPAPQKTRYNRSWVATWNRKINQSGNLISYGNATTAHQGQDPGGSNGNLSTYIGFSGTATDGSGLTIQQALSGADVEEVGLYLYFLHWYYSEGEAVIGMHSEFNPITSQAQAGGDFWRHFVMGWKRAEGRWISLGYLDRQNWASGVYKGIILGSPAAGGLGRYGYAAGAGDPYSAPVLNITYWR